MNRFETQTIHANQDPNRLTGTIIPPISLSTTFKQNAPNDFIGKYDYARSTNPTRESLEVQIASLEGNRYSHVFTSGLATQDAIMRLLKPNDHMLIPHDAYDKTYRLVDTIYAPTNIAFDSVHYNDIESVHQK